MIGFSTMFDAEQIMALVKSGALSMEAALELAHEMVGKGQPGRVEAMKKMLDNGQVAIPSAKAFSPKAWAKKPAFIPPPPSPAPPKSQDAIDAMAMLAESINLATKAAKKPVLKGPAPTMIFFDEMMDTTSTPPALQEARRCEMKNGTSGWRPFTIVAGGKVCQVRNLEQLMEVYAGPFTRQLMVGFTVYYLDTADLYFRFVVDTNFDPNESPPDLPVPEPEPPQAPAGGPEDREFS